MIPVPSTEEPKMPIQTDQPEWDAMFDLQWGLIEEIDKLIKDRVRGLPVIVQSTVRLYIIEHLAEHARFNIELPQLPWKSEPEAHHQ